MLMILSSLKRPCEMKHEQKHMAGEEEVSKTFSHELVEVKMFLGENKAVTFKEGGASNKSGYDKGEC
ncbi:hypothetical protein BTVI_86746 [Pitangus sulphuratus]|nr:hypothetical protein BTVI_86746 [Pitangus sulphuratus]